MGAIEADVAVSSAALVTPAPEAATRSQSTTMRIRRIVLTEAVGVGADTSRRAIYPGSAEQEEERLRQPLQNMPWPRGALPIGAPRPRCCSERGAGRARRATTRRGPAAHEERHRAPRRSVGSATPPQPDWGSTRSKRPCAVAGARWWVASCLRQRACASSW